METIPRTSDEAFYNALKDEYRDVKDAAGQGKYEEAMHLFANHARNELDRDRFLKIPYERAENIYTLPGESDEEAVKRICNYVMVSVGIPCDFSKERRVDWTANPTENGYKEWPWQLNRHNDIKLLAHQYNITGDEEIAKTALSMMRSWIESCPVPSLGTPGYETKCWRTIECGIRMGANWPYILFSFIKSPYFTDDLILLWFKSIYEHAQRLLHDRMHANWLIMEMNGLAHIGMLYPFFKDSEMWFNEAVSTLEKELYRQFYPDGFQYELTTNYHDVAINNYQRLFETAKVYERPLSASFYKILTKACDVDVLLMRPDGRLPDINDGCTEFVRTLLKPKARFFNDDAIEYIVTDGKKGSLPEPPSQILPYSGFAIFRSGWSQDDIWGLFDAAPFGRGHQHEDKLSFTVYANGRYIIPEAGIYAYDDSDMRQFVLSTRGHNTVRVDRRDQDRRSTYQWHEEDINKHSGIEYEFKKDMEWAEGIYDEAYEGIDDHIVHRRRITFLKKERIFIVSDVLESEKAHEFELIWHVDDEMTGKLQFKDISIFIPSPDTEISVVIGHEGKDLQGFIATSVKQGDYKPVPTIIAHRSGTNVEFTTVIQPKGVEKEIKSVSLEEKRVVLHFKDHSQDITV